MTARKVAAAKTATKKAPARKPAARKAPAAKKPAAKKSPTRPRKPPKPPTCHHRIWALEEIPTDDGDVEAWWECADCGARTVPSVELEVLADLRRMANTTDVHGGLAASALTLARALDKGAGLSTAAIARELRTTLDAISKEGDAGDGDQASALLDRLLSA